MMEAGLAACRDLGLRDLHFSPSSLFPCHQSLLPFLRDGTVGKITTAYLNGPVADFISEGHFPGSVCMTTHGGRARSFFRDCSPDLAIVAAPATDTHGNISGLEGPFACGPLGYAMVDAQCSKYVIAATATGPSQVSRTCIAGDLVNEVVQVAKIGNPGGLASGTTARQVSAEGTKMASVIMELIRNTGHLRDGLNIQCGAGSIPLEVVRMLGKSLSENSLTCGFVSGGIIKAHVDMLREGLTHKLYNVQSFDLDAVASCAADAGHVGISADLYANPDRSDCVAHRLNVTVLGAAEVDTDFNVNVTTTGAGRIIGGSGGHSDIAEGADLTIVVLPFTGRHGPRVVNRVARKTTGGRHVDVVVTSNAVCVNPRRDDLLQDLRSAGMVTTDIQDLAQPKQTQFRTGRPVAHIEDRRGNTVDVLRAVGQH